MRFAVVLFTRNDAFQPEAAPEVARILRELADDLADEGRALGVGDCGELRDVNGNTVGRWKATGAGPA